MTAATLWLVVSLILSAIKALPMSDCGTTWGIERKFYVNAHLFCPTE